MKNLPCRGVAVQVRETPSYFALFGPFRCSPVFCQNWQKETLPDSQLSRI